MDIRVLKYFLAVVREENITKAANVLHVTQPTLSRQLSKMEEDLGVQLFVRGKKGITLTYEGLLLRRRAEEIVELADKMERELAEHEELIDGEVSIGCGELASVQLLPELFKTFKKRYPRVVFDLYTGNADQIKQKLDNGLVDMGILMEPVSIDKYDFMRLNIKEHWGTLMRADSPLSKKEFVTVDDLENEPLILPRRLRHEIESWFRGHMDKMNVIATSDMSTNAAILVEQNFGYALIVEGSVPFLDASRVCYRPIFPERTGTSVLAWKKNQPFAPAVKKFLEHAQNTLKA